MKRLFLITTTVLLFFTACKKREGCTDISAINYNTTADHDDGSCLYSGCTDLTATNYNSNATNDDGSCHYSLRVNFTHTVDGNPLVLNQMTYKNEAEEDYSVQTLRYLISDIMLHSDNETHAMLDEVHFVTISDTSTLKLIIEDLENINYSAISFTMGLDSLKNITNNYLNESFFPSFTWPLSMGGGYHYMQLEGDYIDNLQGYATHTGGTNGKDFSFSKNFPFTMNINSINTTIEINMEINNWYSNPNTINFTTDGIMDDANKQTLIQANGIADVFSVNVSYE